MSDTPTSTPLGTEARRRPWWVVALLGLLVFTSGAITGAGTTVFAARWTMRRNAQNPERMVKAMLVQRLGLSSEQQAQLDGILVRHNAEFAAAREQFVTVQKAVANDIEGILTPAQKDTFARMKSRWGGRGPGMPGMPGMPGKGGPHGRGDHPWPRDHKPLDGTPPGPPMGKD